MELSPEQVIEQLCALDLSGLDQVGLQQLAVRLGGLAGRLTGRLDQVLGELDARGQGVVVANVGADGQPLFESTQRWWRDAATLTGEKAGRDVRRAAVLRDLPLLAQAVTDGQLSPAQVAVLCPLHEAIPLPDLVASQQALIVAAQGRDTDALGRFVTHLIATHCEPALEADQDRAHERRYLQLRTDPDGTVHGRFVLASEDAEALKALLEPLARKQGLDDTRSAGQRRADALSEVFHGAAAWMDLPHAGGQRPQLSYVVHSGWSAGDDPLSLPEQLIRHGLHPDALFEHSASAAWTGPQTRARIEAVLCDARINRLLLDAQGAVVGLQSLSDEITPAQRKAVSARDRGCIVRGCHRPPAFCDVHHLLHRADGGPTTVDNLALLCRRHHVLWHKGKLDWHQLHTPWLPDNDPLHAGHDPWDTHSPPLVA